MPLKVNEAFLHVPEEKNDLALDKRQLEGHNL